MRIEYYEHLRSLLSYHSPDHGSVHTIQQLLEARGIATFLDRENLVAGLPWPHALEEALRGGAAR